MASTSKRHPVPSLAGQEPAGYLANPSGGYVRLPRELLDPDHPLSPARTGDPASKREAVADLVAMAAWKDGPERVRGEVLAGTRWLGDRWRWPRTRVRRFLKELESNGTLSWMRGNRKGDPSRLLIVGYSRLQDRPKSGPPTLPPSRPTPSAHLGANNGAGSPGSPAHPDGPPFWPADATPTKEEEQQSYQGEPGKVEGPGLEGGRTSEGEPQKEKERVRDETRRGGSARQPPPPRRQTKGKKSAAITGHVVDGGRRCADCGATIGPTVERCARCAYPATATRGTP